MHLRDRVMRSIALTSAISLPSIFIATGYFGLRWPGQLSFHSDDGWCRPSVNGVGVHCFSDYSDMYFRSPDGPWAHVSGPNAHPPLSEFIQDIFRNIAALAGDRHIGLLLWLTVIAFCVLLPVLWATRTVPSPIRAIEILLLGVATTPFLVALDRGNSSPLAIPALLWFAVSFSRGRDTSAMWAIVLASLIRPQLMVLALLFLFRKDLSNLLRAVAFGILGILLSFALYPGDRVANVTDWIVNLLRYSGYRTPLMPFPQSVGSGRSLVFMGEFVWTRLLGQAPQAPRRVFRADQPPVSSVIDFVQRNHGMLMLLAVAVGLALLVLFWVRGHRLSRFALVTAGCAVPVVTPTVSFTYYLTFLLVPLAILVRSPNANPDFFDAAPRWLERASKAVFVTAITVTLVPTAMPLSLLIPIPTFRAANLFVALAGPLWLVWGALLLLGLLLPGGNAVRTDQWSGSTQEQRRAKANGPHAAALGNLLPRLDSNQKPPD